MRIYDLAKAIGQAFSTDVKSKELADEFKSMPEFAPIHDQIKSHSSSVSDEYAAKMFEIYRQRLGKGRTEQPIEGKESVPSSVLKTSEAKPQPKPVAPTATVPPRPMAPQASTPAAQQPPRPAMPPRPQPAVPPRPQAGLPRPAVPPLGPARPAPLRPTPARPITPIHAPIPAARRVTPIAPAGQPPRPVPAPLTPSKPAAPAPAAPAAQQPAPVAKPAPAPAQTAAPQAPAAPAPAAPKPAAPAAHPVHPVAPQAQKPRPSAPAAKLKSSSGTTGYSAGPERKLNTPESRAGQPTAPAAPKFSADSPFMRPKEPPKPPRRPESRPPREGAAGGPGRPSHPPREGQGTEAPRRRGGAKEEPVVEILQVPEIGVMKLKPAGKRHRGGAGDKGRPGRPGTPAETEAEKAARKKPRPSKVYGGADEFRRPLKTAKRPRSGEMRRQYEPASPKVSGPIVITGPLTVGQFAEKIGVAPAEIIKASFLKGKAITINQLMDLEFAEELAIERDIDLQIRLERDETDIEEFRVEDREEDLSPRPPVVTIMGHVDHGKTTILDFYRRSQVVEGEFGGITQHIGAYQVKTPKGEIVFLDTPGHEAFTAMRARGVQATDIVVLVVAADDGVMPQTIESINHARAAGVPIIVAVNKIDMPQARPERVRTELMQHGILSTQLGGDTEFVEISAKKGINMEALLEIILLQAELLELKANPNRSAEAIVIESHIDNLRGAVATVLVQRGTLKIGQYFVVGQQYGRVRAMLDDHGRTVESSTLAQPVELIGLTGTPEVGETLLVMDDERKAREIAERRLERRRMKELSTSRPITLEGIHEMITEGKIKELNVILKADVQGSVEAISQSLEKLSTEAVRVRILHTGTGSVTENDVNLALASQAIIIGFNVRPEPGASDMAAREHVDIKSYRIIYELLEDVEKALVGMLDKQYTEQAQGRVEVREIFRITKVGMVAGCMVVSGEVHRNSRARLVRDGKVVYDGKIESLRRHKDDASKVAAGYECGIMLERFQDVKAGDIIETYTMQEVTPELTKSQS